MNKSVKSILTLRPSGRFSIAAKSQDTKNKSAAESMKQSTCSQTDVGRSLPLSTIQGRTRVICLCGVFSKHIIKMSLFPQCSKCSSAVKVLCKNSHHGWMWYLRSLLLPQYGCQATTRRLFAVWFYKLHQKKRKKKKSGLAMMHHHVLLHSYGKRENWCVGRVRANTGPAASWSVSMRTHFSLFLK